MHFAALNHIHLNQNPDFDLSNKITLDEDGFRRLQQTRRLAFGSSGTYNVISLFLNDDQFTP